MSRTHGTVSTYNHGCRCGDCRRALREHQRRRRRRQSGRSTDLRIAESRAAAAERAWLVTEVEYFWGPR